LAAGGFTGGAARIAGSAPVKSIGRAALRASVGTRAPERVGLNRRGGHSISAARIGIAVLAGLGA
jgi:hypothetical protein